MEELETGRRGETWDGLLWEANLLISSFHNLERRKREYPRWETASANLLFSSCRERSAENFSFCQRRLALFRGRDLMMNQWLDPRRSAKG